MLHVIWEFEVVPGRVKEFESQYSSNGAWAQFFRKDPAYLGTVLVCDRGRIGHYLTADKWTDFASYEAFKANNQTQYREIDAGFETLTSKETCIGTFEEIE